MGVCSKFKWDFLTPEYGYTEGRGQIFSNFECLCKYKVTSKDYYFAVFVISTNQCDSVKFHGNHFGANLVSNPKIKMAVSQKLFQIQISNFKFFLLSGRGTIGMKIKDQSAWAIR